MDYPGLEVDNSGYEVGSKWLATRITGRDRTVPLERFFWDVEM